MAFEKHRWIGVATPSHGVLGSLRVKKRKQWWGIFLHQRIGHLNISIANGLMMSTRTAKDMDEDNDHEN